MPDSEVLTAALEYARSGLLLVPLRPGEKRPAIKTGKNHSEAASSDQEVIRRWFAEHPDRGVGIPGTANKLVVLDQDGPEGSKTLRSLMNPLELPPTWIVQTGREGGLHWYFRQPEGETVPTLVIGPKLELRADGALAAAPPTLHKSGKRYRTVAGSHRHIAPLPDNLLKLVLAPEHANRPGPQLTVPDDRGFNRLRGLAGRVAVAREGDRNNTLYKKAKAAAGLILAGAGFSEEKAVAELTHAAGRAGLKQAETEATIKSGLKAGYEAGPLGDRYTDQSATSASPRETPEPGPSLLEQAKARIVGGGDFALDAPELDGGNWGRGNDVLKSSGEYNATVGPEGVFKSTVEQAVTLARLGLADPDPLGYPVKAFTKPHLYLAMDRATQIARSMQRMVGPENRQALNDGLLVLPGHLPADFVTAPDLLPELCRDLDVGSVTIDSLKDVASGLSKDEVGSRVAHVLQTLIAETVEVDFIHHQRKATSDNKKPNKLADVYGSRWITAGAGAVLLLWGHATSPVVELSLLKKAANDITPFRVRVDLATGELHRQRTPDPVEYVEERGEKGGTARGYAEWSGTADPSPGDIEKARRGLEKAFNRDAIAKVPGLSGHPARYVPKGLLG